MYQEEDLLRKKLSQAWQGIQLIPRLCFQWASPAPAPLDAPLSQKEAVRRGQLTSIVLLILMSVGVAYIPLMMREHIRFFSLANIGVFLFLGIAAYVNRLGKSNLAGLITILTVEFVSLAVILFFPDGFNLSIIPVYDFLIIPTLLAVSLLPSWSVFPVMASNIVVILATIILLPKSPDLQTLFMRRPASVIAIPILLQVICSSISFLWVRGSLQALKETARADILDHLYQEQARAAETDAITGLPNHRALMSYLHKTVDRCREQQGKFALMFVDLDHFKQVNDTWGHLAGDAVLRKAGKSLQAAIAGHGLVARYGGEEFAILMEEDNLQFVYELAEAIRSNIASSPCLWENGDKGETIEIAVTGSIGVALYGLHGTTATSLLERADHAMYQAKLQGRNRVCIAGVDAEAGSDSGVQNRHAETSHAVMASVQALAAAANAHDGETGDHAQRMVWLADLVATRLGCSTEERRAIRQAAVLHDVGKVGVPEQILRKPGSLTTEEWGVMRTHPQIGAQILNQVEGVLDHLAPLVEAHHERWDGAGYPLGLRHDEIPLGARILSVVDSYDAMTSTRPYRQALPIAEVRAELKRCAGAQYDPRVVEVFLELLELHERSLVEEPDQALA